jgi:hypothetical protein
LTIGVHQHGMLVHANSALHFWRCNHTTGILDESPSIYSLPFGAKWCLLPLPCGSVDEKVNGVVNGTKTRSDSQWDASYQQLQVLIVSSLTNHNEVIHRWFLADRDAPAKNQAASHEIVSGWFPAVPTSRPWIAPTSLELKWDAFPVITNSITSSISLVPTTTSDESSTTVATTSNIEVLLQFATNAGGSGRHALILSMSHWPTDDLLHITKDHQIADAKLQTFAKIVEVLDNSINDPFLHAHQPIAFVSLHRWIHRQAKLIYYQPMVLV